MRADQDRLIELISNEVIKHLQSNNIGSTSSPNQPSASQGAKLAKMIDHTLLKPEASYDDIKRLCKEAAQFGFASVCVNPANVALAVELLQDTEIPVCSVVGFPLGAATTKTKVFEARDAIENGAEEIDMVINVGALKSKDEGRVKEDIRGVVAAAKGRAKVKVIIETCLLTDQEKIRACELAQQAGADFVKTSTGFGSGGATVSDIQLMRKVVGPHMGVKASGGIGSYKDAAEMLEAGACTFGDHNLCRLGTSKSLKLLQK